jgi:hypothetical protein
MKIPQNELTAITRVPLQLSANTKHLDVSIDVFLKEDPTTAIN